MKKLVFISFLFLILAISGTASALSVTVMDGDHNIIDGTLAGHLGLTGLGHTSTLYADTTANWATVLSGSDPIVVEQRGYDYANTASVLSFLNGGGTLILTGDFSADNFMNSLFGWSTSIGGYYLPSTYWTKTSATTGTTFADDAVNLYGLSSIHPIESGAPSGVDVLWTNGSYGPIALHYSVGAGDFFYLGWDYCCGGTIDQGNDWYGVLDSALNYSPVPEPATMLLLGSGLIGVAGFRRKIKK